MLYLTIGLVFNFALVLYHAVRSRKIEAIDVVLAVLFAPFWPIVAYGFVRAAMTNMEEKR